MLHSFVNSKSIRVGYSEALSGRWSNFKEVRPRFCYGPLWPPGSPHPPEKSYAINFSVNSRRLFPNQIFAKTLLWIISQNVRFVKAACHNRRAFPEKILYRRPACHSSCRIGTLMVVIIQICAVWFHFVFVWRFYKSFSFQFCSCIKYMFCKSNGCCPCWGRNPAFTSFNSKNQREKCSRAGYLFC